MKSLSISEVRNSLPQILKKISKSHETITILRYGKPIASTQLPGNFHKDPADRIIVALARRQGASLVTSDRKILDYAHVATIW